MSEQLATQSNEEYLAQHPDAVQDADKAFEMATASNSARTEAANSRSNAKVYESLLSKTGEIVDTLLPHAIEYNESFDAIEEAEKDPNWRKDVNNADALIEKSKEAYNKFYDEAEKLDIEPIRGLKTNVVAANGVLHEATETKDAEEIKERVAANISRNVEDSIRYSKEKDDEAERLERWAEILHDTPPSHAFMERYKHKKITPKELLSLEREVREQEQAAALITERVTQLLESPSIMFKGKGLDLNRLLKDKALFYYELINYRSDVKDGITFDPNLLFRRVESDKVNNQDLAGEWLKLSAQPDTTLGQLHDIYKTAVWERLSPRLDRYKINETFLDDIRSGRASQWKD